MFGLFRRKAPEAQPGGASGVDEPAPLTPTAAPQPLAQAPQPAAAAAAPAAPSAAPAPAAAPGPAAPAALPANPGSGGGGGSSSSSSSGGGGGSAGAAAMPAAPPPSGLPDILLQELPRLLDAPPGAVAALLLQKLEVASVTGLNWGSAEADRQAKDVKLRTLSELVDFMGSPQNQKLVTEALYEPCVGMVCANIFRSLPMPKQSVEEATGASGGSGGEGGDDSDPPLEPAWSHLHLVYEFLLRFILSTEVKTKAAKKWVDASFCAKLVELFESDDPREREYLKTILHRIYGKFMMLRSSIRKSISHAFLRFVYETERHSGASELLEILGSIINGFALPLKPEHVTFLEKVLLPLLRLRHVQSYLLHLTYCVTQYVQKDPAMVVHVCTGLAGTWPWTSSAKQVLMLNVLEEVLELAGAEACAPVLPVLALLLARCVAASHFQVAERALQLWQNPTLASGLLGGSHARAMLPSLHAPLQRLSAGGHWNPGVHALAVAVLKHYEDADSAVYKQCAAASEAAGVGAGAGAGAGASAGAGAGAGAGGPPGLRGRGLSAEEEARKARRLAWRQVDAAAAAAAAAAALAGATAAQRSAGGGRSSGT